MGQGSHPTWEEVAAWVARCKPPPVTVWVNPAQLAAVRPVLEPYSWVTVAASQAVPKGKAIVVREPEEYPWRPPRDEGGGADERN